MDNGVVENGVCYSESVTGSRDIWSCKDSDSASANHLVIMVNGILGRSALRCRFLFLHLYLLIEPRSISGMKYLLLLSFFLGGISCNV